MREVSSFVLGIVHSQISHSAAAATGVGVPDAQEELIGFFFLAQGDGIIGSVDGLPPDLGARKKYYLKVTGYGRKRPR